MNTRWQKGMRDFFFQSLLEEAKKDPDLILMTSDIGAICHDQFKEELRHQYINVGIAEQNMIGVAAGLAMSGKRIYLYSIIPFISMRCYEQIRIDLCCMNLPVTLIGIGAGMDYSTLGTSHHGTEDIAVMRSLPKMTIYNPSDGLIAERLAKIPAEGPSYIRLDRTGLPLVYKKNALPDLTKGFFVFEENKDFYIIATGRMVSSAIEIAEQLSQKSISIGVIDLFRIKPINTDELWGNIQNAKGVITLEEHSLIGGIGSAVSEVIATQKNPIPLKPFGIPDEFCKSYGDRQYLQSLYNLDQQNVQIDIEKWINTF